MNFSSPLSSATVSPAKDALDIEQAQIPDALRKTVLKLPAEQRGAILQFIQIQEAHHLALINPALVLYTIERIQKLQLSEPQDPAQRRKIFLRKQRLLCAEAGLPGTEGTAKILRKLEPECCTKEALDDLRELLTEGAVLKLLAHLPRLSPTVLGILISPALRKLVSYPLLFELTTTKEFDFGSFPRSELKEWGNLVAWSPTTETFRSLAELRNRRERAQLAFPDSPLDMPLNFQPLTSAQELFLEGNEQNNCIRRYIERVLSRRWYVYKLSAPERATIAVKVINGRWQLNEIKGASNEQVHWDTEEYVRDVIANCQDGSSLAIPQPTLEYPAYRNLAGINFPPPPLHLPPEFTPLTSALQLIHEGNIPRDRVEDYIDNIMNGSLYAYLLMEPVGVTVLIETLDWLFWSDELRPKLNWQIVDVISHEQSTDSQVHEYIREVIEGSQNGVVI